MGAGCCGSTGGWWHLGGAVSNDQTKRSADSAFGSADSAFGSADTAFGSAVWCSFPSNDGQPSLTPGIWTTDRSGVAGYNQGSLQKGDPAGHYSNSFGGTSSACPGVAGVEWLILARNSALRWDQVQEFLRQSCVRIDAAGGTYDASGRSPYYGFGRVNARKSVELALPLAGQGQLKTIKVVVDLDHTFIGNLVLKLLPPVALGIAPVVLHNQAGGSTDNIKKTYDQVNTPALTSLKGNDPSGIWTLEVADKARADAGTLRSLRLVLTF